jgi:hypothetical protein
MISPELLAEQLAIEAHISKLTAQQVVRFWKRLDSSTLDRPAMIEFVNGAIRQITSAYGELAAVRAAEFYDEVREVGGFSGKAAVPVSGKTPEEQLKAVVRWGIGPLWEETPRPDAALKRLVGSTQRLSLQPGRNTIYEMVKRDRIRYAHMPQGKTCAFCMMLASRGAVYWSDRKPQYHDLCDCLAVPVSTPDDLPDINRELQEEWQFATRGRRDQVGAWNEYVAEKYPGTSLLSRGALKTTANRRGRTRF